MEESKAGRNLDKKIHEFVMGGRFAVSRSETQTDYEKFRKEIEHCPDYSTDIAEAWQVLRYLTCKDNAFKYQLTSNYEITFDRTYNYCVIRRHSDDPIAKGYALTAAEAICLAALDFAENNNKTY